MTRFLLYGHDSWGLGHLRRNLNLASALTATFPDSNALVLTGSSCATQFPLPDRVDLVKLPAVTKGSGGAYEPRTLSGSIDSLVQLREHILLETFRAFSPDALIVDHQVIGLRGEVLELLREARRAGVRTILGLRDVIDAPQAVARDWSSHSCRWALTEGYDRVCVYGDVAVFDPRTCYPILPELGDRVEFTGYVVRPQEPGSRRPLPSLRRRVLVTMGGGEDGAARIATYLKAIELGPTEWESTIITGPLLDRREVHRLKFEARSLGVTDVRRFHADLPRLLGEADAIVSMAGYNTTAEVLQSGKPAVLLPRTQPRREQAIRAERLARLRLADMLISPTPEKLRARVKRALNKSPATANRPRMDGSRTMCDVVERVLSQAPRRLSKTA